jgi:hypothetical protein
LVGRKLLDLPGYAFRVFVTNRRDPALEIWRDYNGRATVECRIDKLKNELAPTTSACDLSLRPLRLSWLLGYQFSPRIADIGGARFWRIDPKVDYGPLNNFASHKVNGSHSSILG